MDKKEWTKEITFTKGERVALIILILFLLLSYIYNFWYHPQIALDNKHYDLNELLTEVPNEEHTRHYTKATKWLDPKAKPTWPYPKPSYEPFNPNTIDSSKWIQLGVKPWTIKSIMKYKAKGGKFRKCTDLNNIFNMDDAIKKNIIPHCNIPVKVKKSTYKKKEKKAITKIPKILTAFDPNTIDSAAWLALGVKPWTIKSIMKFRSKGGRFNKCDDLNEIFNMDDSTKEELIPYCSIRLLKVNVNTADTTQLKKLKGIGPATAKSIIQYRDKLGGYINHSQLLETWGVSEELLADLKDQLIIDGKITKLNLNEEDSSPLFKHPYIEYNTAKVIVNYRKQHGDFKEISDIKKTRVISDEDYFKLAPYLGIK